METIQGAVLSELRTASNVLSARGLNQAAKWSAEMLLGASAPRSAAATTPVLTPMSPASNSYSFMAGLDIADPQTDVDVFAKTLFDCREFTRAAHVLDGAHSDMLAYPPRPFFLRCYALYLVSCACDSLWAICFLVRVLMFQSPVVTYAFMRAMLCPNHTGNRVRLENAGW